MIELPKLRELWQRVEALEAAAQRHRTFAANEVAPSTSLHSYKIGEAEPIEDWGKDHTLVNPEPSLKEQALEALQNMDYMNQFPNEHDYNTIRRALEALDD
jgi:hypothetical protein